MTTYQCKDIWSKIILLFAPIKLLHKILQRKCNLNL